MKVIPNSKTLISPPLDTTEKLVTKTASTLATYHVHPLDVSIKNIDF